MRKILFLFLLMIIGGLSAQERLQIWPKGQMPNSKGLNLKANLQDPAVSTKEAELFAFLPPKAERTKRSVIIVPGGGYSKLTYNEGAFQIAKWMNTLGISAFVLNYRLPTSPDLVQREIAPLQDLQMAVKFLRENASEYGISSNQVGVVGTSAGGHLAAMASNINIDYTGLKGDGELISTIPDFAVLFCPVIDFGEFAHLGSRNSLLGENASPEKISDFSMQNLVTEKTPPTILFHNEDDKAVPANNSILYYKAMMKNKVKGAMFIFPEGGHRFSITNKNELSEKWKILCKEWLLSLDSK